MRQAGRALPEYRAIRGEGSILDAIRKPELAAEITLQPVRRYGVDAAILYSDIVVPVAAIGFGVDVAPGTGPVTEQPFRSEADLVRLRPLEPELDIPYVLETVKILSGELDVPLIGFAGAPFTVASYLIEGGPSRTYARTKSLMYGDPALWHRLLDRLADIAIRDAARTGRGGRASRAAVRQLGGRPQRARLRSARVAREPKGAGRRGRSRRASHPLRCGHRRAARADGFGRGGRARGRLEGAARRRTHAGRERRDVAGQPRPFGLPR